MCIRYSYHRVAKNLHKAPTHTCNCCHSIFSSAVMWASPTISCTTSSSRNLRRPRPFVGSYGIILEAGLERAVGRLEGRQLLKLDPVPASPSSPANPSSLSLPREPVLQQKDGLNELLALVAYRAVVLNHHTLYRLDETTLDVTCMQV